MSKLKEKTINGVFWSSVDRFSVQGIQFVLGVVMARLLSPSDYGIIAMLAIFMALSQSFIDSGFSNALIRKLDRTEKDFATAFYFNIIVAIVCYFILFFTSPYIASFYNTPILESLTKVLALTFVFNSLCVVQQAKLTIDINFKTQAKVSIISVVVSGIIGIYLAYKGSGVWALAIQNIINSFMRMALLWILAKWRPIECFSKSSFQNLFSYGSKLLLSGILDVTYNNIYTIVIGKVFKGNILGNYSRADQFAQFPSSNITGVLQRVTFPVLSSIQDNDERLRYDYRKFLRLSAFIVFPLMIGLASVAKPFVLLLLTSKWSNTIILMQIICFALMWYPVHAINLNLLQVKGRSDLFLKLEIMKKILGVCILCISIPLGIIAMCLGRIVSSLLCLILNTYYTGKLIKVGFFIQMKDLIPIFINSLIMGVIVVTTTSIFDNNVLKLLLGILVGGTYYLLSNYLTKTSELKELYLIIKRK